MLQKTIRPIKHGMLVSKQKNESNAFKMERNVLEFMLKYSQEFLYDPPKNYALVRA